VGRQFRIGRIATGITAAFLLASVPASAATITPTAGLADEPPTNNSNCTLREAVIAANTDTAVDLCAAGEPAPAVDEIDLSAGTYNLSSGIYHQDATSGDLNITHSVTIVGAGPNATTIDARGADPIANPAIDRVFDVEAGATVEIRAVKITGGQAYDPGASASGGDGGGGIFNAGTLTLKTVSVTGNHSGGGGTGGTGQCGQPGGDGGGVFSDNGASLSVIDSTISANTTGSGGDPGASASGQPSCGANSGGNGGGIGTASGATALTITNSVISGNQTGAGGAGVDTSNSPPTPGQFDNAGAGGCGGYGGGVFAYGTITIAGTTISGNSTGDGAVAGNATGTTNGGVGGCGGLAGGLYSVGTLTMTNSDISGNSTGAGAAGGTGVAPGAGGTGGYGGGVIAGNGSIEATTISGNTVGDSASGGFGGYGGGLAEFFGTLAIARSTISGNRSGTGGSGATGGHGGGIYVDSGQLTVVNSTIADNQAGGGSGGGAGGKGGGAFQGIGATTSLTHVTIAGNKVASNATGAGLAVVSNTLTLTNSIVASNMVLGLGTVSNCAASGGSIADGGHDVSFGDTSCPGVNGNPLLAALASNGGSTKTMALGEGSSAIDVVPSTGADCPPTDQRGTTRPQRSACDAGAFEAEPLPPATGGGPPPGGGSTTPPPAGSTTPPDTIKPVVSLLLKAQRLVKALKKGYRAGFSSNEAGSAVVELFAEGKDAKRAAVKRKRIARGTLTFASAGRKTVVAKFTKKAKKAFARRGKLRVLLVLTVKDKAGNATKVSRRVTLKR
jgi:CSLREA domain-containing protein